jgi:hypothetical protein
MKKGIQDITTDLNVILRTLLQLANVRADKKRRNYFLQLPDCRENNREKIYRAGWISVRSLKVR